MCLVSHGTIELLKRAEALAQVCGYEKRAELTTHDEHAQTHQQHDEKDRDNGDKHVSNDQPPAKAPRPDQCHEPAQIVKQANSGHEPKQDPERCWNAAGKPVHTRQDSAAG